MVLNKIQLLWVSIWNRWPQSATRSVGFLAFELSEINGQHRLLRRRPTHTAGHETRTIVRGMENGERRTELELGAGGALIRRRLFAVRFMTRHAKRAKKEKINQEKNKKRGGDMTQNCRTTWRPPKIVMITSTQAPPPAPRS